MTSSRKPPAPEITDDSGHPLCAACLSPAHELRGCDTPRAVEILVEQDRLMSADVVRRRIGKGAAS